MVVVFPAPFGPSSPVTRPGSTVTLRSSTAATGLNLLVRCSIWITTSRSATVAGGREDTS